MMRHERRRIPRRRRRPRPGARRRLRRWRIVAGLDADSYAFTDVPSAADEGT